MSFRTSVLVVAGLLSSVSLFAQNTPRQKAQSAYFSAEEKEKTLNEQPREKRTRADYLKVINAYERVYLITPQTSYADNALITIARLYEEIQEIPSALKTLNFLLREYPQSPFKRNAEESALRLQQNPPATTTAARNVEQAPQKAATAVAATAAVDNLRYWEAQNSVRVVVDVSGEINFKQGEAKNPDRVFIDVTPAKLNASLTGKQWPVKSGLLQQIRVGQYENATVRIVLDLGTLGRVTAFTLTDPNRLVIDVIGTGLETLLTPKAAESETPVAAPLAIAPTPSPSVSLPASVTTVAASPKPVASVDVPKESAPIPEPPAVTPAKPTNRGDRSLIRSLGLKISRVVIDAGHGGHDTGTVGPSGYTEKELVLDVARRLKDLVEKELGAEVVMTRNDDVFVPLEARTAIANEQDADLFISIHANSSKVKSVRGVETFFLNLPSNRDDLEIASRENAASQKTIHELQDVVKQIMLSDKLDESRELARHIQNAMANRKGSGSNRGVKQAPFVVLIGANMPSILAEIAFISNPQEEKAIKTAAYRQSIAESLFGGVKSYAETLSGIKTAKSQEKN